MPEHETDAEKSTGSDAAESAPGRVVGEVVAAVGESLKQKARDSVRSIVVEPLRTAALKAAMLAVLFACVALAVIFLFIGIVALLDGFFRTPGIPYLIVAGLMLIVAFIVGQAVGRDEGKGKDKTN